MQASTNPFCKAAQGGNPVFPGAAGGPAESVRISKELLQEIRSEDAAMADELAALAPRSGRAFPSSAEAASGKDGQAAQRHAQRSTASSAAAGGATTATAGPRYAPPAHEAVTASDFVKQKREVGLVRMSLATKKAEIRNLDEKMNRAEKRLRQQQEQLTNTQEKFNSFLKFSNLEQDAAVRRADEETRARHLKTIEIKKLFSLINHAELGTRETALQIENCVAYKEFLESLTKSQWFFDVLTQLRMEDKREEILLQAEQAYEQESAVLKRQYQESVAARQAAREHEERDQPRRKVSGSTGHAGGAASSTGDVQHSGRHGSGNTTFASGGAGTAEPPEPEEPSLEKQLDDLHDGMEVDVRASLARAEAAVTADVAAMNLASVKHALHNDYDESRLPMCFANVDDLLEVFINVEEGNLFLIQNCQELEEELEGISMGFLKEKTEMSTMVTQRTAQLAVLQDNIAEAQEKLKTLNDRIAALEPRSVRPTVAASASGGTLTTDGASKSLVTQPTAAAAINVVSNVNLSPAAYAEMSPEELKVRIETSIGHMFQILTAGDQLIKSASNNNALASGDGGGGGGAHAHQRNNIKSSIGGGGRDGVSFAGTFTRTNVSDGGSPFVTSAKTGKANTWTGSPKSQLDSASSTRIKKSAGSGASSALKTNAKAKKAVSSTAAAQQQLQQQQQQQQQQRDASMGPVEMLTVVENKLEEYHRYLTDATHRVDPALMQAVMKQSDKQRRRQARLEHLASQEQEQEERIKRALERSQAPIAHRIGKPVRPRSHVYKTGDDKTQQRTGRSTSALRGSGTSIDSDEDGAEFFK